MKTKIKAEKSPLCQLIQKSFWAELRCLYIGGKEAEGDSNGYRENES